ncbi:MAG: type I CRISPR-associated protein Cas7, partial [Arcobacteraceae bacterium]|nr:type I CRISPR-associated protein Cas7 [Arcobacteraceae bacterium]
VKKKDEKDVEVDSADSNKKPKKGKTVDIQAVVQDYIQNNQGFEIKKELNSNYLLGKTENDKTIYHIIGQKPDDIKRIPILQNLLSAIDIRLFGASFASIVGNMSILGNVQITHGLNIYPENNIFSEDITSPFRNPNAKSEDSMQTTIGNQTALEEGHYLHNFTINPKNSEELVNLIDNQGYLTNEDIANFQEAINKGVTYLDSASKSGVENEFSIFITLNEKSKIQLPSFNTLVKVEKQNGFKRKLDLSKVKELLNEEIFKDKIAKVEIFLNEYALDYGDEIFDIQNVCVKSIVSGKELQKCQK